VAVASTPSDAGHGWTLEIRLSRPTWYWADFGRSRSNRMDIGMREVPRTLQTRGPRPLGWGVALWLTHKRFAPRHVCYRAEFSHCRSNRMTVSKGSQKTLGTLGPRPLGWGHSWLPRNMPQLAEICSFSIKWYECNYGDLSEKFDPSYPAFQVTQGHQNWHRSIGYLWLPINVALQLWACLVPFKR